jgi:hypothetical protein
MAVHMTPNEDNPFLPFHVSISGIASQVINVSGNGSSD